MGWCYVKKNKKCNLFYFFVFVNKTSCMSLSSGDKTFLNSNIETIRSSFNLFKSRRPYMGVFITDISKPYITFSMTNDFGESIAFGKSNYRRICTYISAYEFDTQTSSFLA